MPPVLFPYVCGTSTFNGWLYQHHCPQEKERKEGKKEEWREGGREGEREERRKEKEERGKAREGEREREREQSKAYRFERYLKASLY